MKYLNLILIAILFVAVGILYFLHFQHPDAHPMKGIKVEDSASSSVLYVNIDTLMSKMEMYKDIQAGLAKKQKDLESNFALRYKSFENNVNEAQKRLSDPTAIVTQIQRDQIDQQLNKQRQDLENLQSSYMNQLQQEGVNANRMIVEYITEYLNGYVQGKGIQYILSYGFGGNILYTDSNLDLTSDVLYGLNEKYLKEKSMKK